MKKELLPCPFCFSSASLVVVDSSMNGPGYSFVQCDNCQAQTRDSSLDRYASADTSKADAENKHDADSIKIWNTREPYKLKMIKGVGLVIDNAT